MTVTPIHHIPMKPEYKSPFSAAYAVQDSRLIFFSGCCTVPVYHKHPHDPVEEEQWLNKDFREQCERTFLHMGEVLKAGGADFSDVVFLTIYLTDMESQNILNQISARHFDPANPPGRSLIQVAGLAHSNMLIEIDGIAAVDPAR